MLFGGGTRRDEEFAAQVAQVEGAIAEAIATLIDVEGLTGAERRQLAHGLVGLAEGTSRLWVAEGGRSRPSSSPRSWPTSPGAGCAASAAPDRSPGSALRDPPAPSA